MSRGNSRLRLHFRSAALACLAFAIVQPQIGVMSKRSAGLLMKPAPVSAYEQINPLYGREAYWLIHRELEGVAFDGDGTAVIAVSVTEVDSAYRLSFRLQVYCSLGDPAAAQVTNDWRCNSR